MEYRIRTDLFRPAAVVAIAGAVSLVVSVAVAARAYRGHAQDARERRTLEVKGLAVKRVRSDIAVWHIGVRGEAPALKEAYDKLDGGFRRVRAFLADKGFPEAEIDTGAIDTETQYRRNWKGIETHEVSGYTLRRGITVTSATLDRISAAAGEVTRFIGEGFLVVSSAPEYHYSGLAGLKIELLGLAAHDARTRAEQIVGNAGGNIGELVDAQMGVLQITRPLSTETSSGGVYDTDTIEKDVRAVVTVTFRVDS